MKVAVYTSFTFSYLAKARVLAASLKKFHPDWTLFALITDEPPSGFKFDVASEMFDEVIWSKDLEIPDFDNWIRNHDIVEACTAVKGPALLSLCNKGFDAVMYLDPDVAVMGSLDPAIQLLQSHEIVLTPHQLSPEDHDDHVAIIDNELASTKHGVFNLGFLLISTTGAGLSFAQWWAARLSKYCRNDICNGMFTDQRWCDLVPSYFSNVLILRDPGYNVASWNLSQRRITINDLGELEVNGYLLRFFHFTKLGPIGRAMTQRYAGENYIVYEIWSWYAREIEKHSEPMSFDWFYAGDPVHG